MDTKKTIRILSYIKKHPGVSRQKILKRFEINGNTLSKIVYYNSKKIEVKSKEVIVHSKNIHGTESRCKCLVNTYIFKGSINTAIV